MTRIRVFHLVHGLWIGGVERMVSALVPSLQECDGLDNFAGVLWPPGELERCIADAYVPLYRFDRSRLTAPELVRKLRMTLSELSIDILHMHDFSATLWGCLGTIGSTVRKRVVTHHQVEGWHGGPLGILKRKVVKRILNGRIDGHVAVCDAVRRSLVRDDTVPDGRISVIYNGIDLAPFERGPGREIARRQLGLPTDVPILGMIGRCSREKGGEVFLRSLKALETAGLRFLGVVVGDGPMREAWEALARDLGLALRVRFMGRVSHQNMPGIVRCLDVGVVSSYAEACSLAIVELMACGVPVVATRVGGNEELVGHGITGYLVPPARPAEMAERIAALMDSPVERESMGRNAVRKARDRLSINSMTQEYARLYRHLYSHIDGK